MQDRTVPDRRRGEPTEEQQRPPDYSQYRKQVGEEEAVSSTNRTLQRNLFCHYTRAPRIAPSQSNDRTRMRQIRCTSAALHNSMTARQPASKVAAKPRR